LNLLKINKNKTMSLDVGLIVRKHKRGCSFYNVCLSTKRRTYLETMPKDCSEEDIKKRTKELNEEIANGRGAYYEAIFYQEWSKKHSYSEVNNKIDEIKEDTAREMKEVIRKTLRSVKTVAHIKNYK